MPTESSNMCIAVCIPQAKGLIIGSRNDAGAIGGECDSSDLEVRWLLIREAFEGFRVQGKIRWCQWIEGLFR
jgi:hypothetical protein